MQIGLYIQMQKGSSSSKRVGSGVEVQPEQYKSESSKGSSSSKGKQKFSVQNIKEFKHEIDHQIAKCLDTLDRQGLKFLKETLRASKIFGLNTQELANTQSIQEQLQFSPEIEPKQKSPLKKTNTKNHIVVKKVTKPQPLKKPATAQKHPRVESKNDLAEKIHKKLESLNIKTGKKQQTKSTQQIKREDGQKQEKAEPRSANEIAQQIVVQQTNEEQVVSNNVSVKIQQSIDSQDDSHSVKYLQPKSQVEDVAGRPAIKELQKDRQFAESIVVGTPTKPFSKKPFKKIHNDHPNTPIQQPDRIQISQQQPIQQLINPSPQTNPNQKHPQDLKQQPKSQSHSHQHYSPQPQNNLLITDQEKGATLKGQAETLKGEEKGKVGQRELQPQMANLIAKINKLSPSKRGKLERILQKLQQSPLIQTSVLSLGSNSSKGELSYMNPYIAQKNSFFKQSNSQEKNKSRSKFEKVEKATSIKNSMTSKRYQQQIGQTDLQGPNNSQKQSQSSMEYSYQRPAPTQSAKHARQLTGQRQQAVQEQQAAQGYQGQQAAQGYQGQQAIGNAGWQKPIKPEETQIQLNAGVGTRGQNKEVGAAEMANLAKMNEQLPNSLKDSISSASLRQKQESLSPAMLQSGQRLIKVGKKKVQPTNVKIKILSNNGHPSLVCLSNITFFSQLGEVIPIEESNLKPPNSKLLKLFTSSNDGWTAPISSATVLVQSISQPLGGIRIVNFNKSELENSKQADLAEIFVQDQLQWRGQLRAGSFKQGENYTTDIKISSKDFIFPNSPKNSTSKSRLFQGQSLRDSLADSRDQKPKKEADWLEKQSVSEKLRLIAEEQKNELVTKKIQSIRNTTSSLPENKLAPQNRSNYQPEPQQKSELLINKNVSRVNVKEDKKYNLEQMPSPKQINMKAVITQNEDILGEISKSLGLNRRQNGKEDVRQPKKREQLLLKKEKQKEREQDDQFQQILKNFEQRDRQQQKGSHQAERAAKIPSQPTFKQQKSSQDQKGKPVVQKSLEQFMKDSLFDDIPNHKKLGSLGSNQKIESLSAKQEPEVKPSRTKFQESKTSIKKINNNDLDDLIDELNDVVGSQCVEESGEEFSIPQLPKGKELTLVVLSNWGNQHFSGLNGIQIFDSNGDLAKPTSITSSSLSSQLLLEKLCKAQLLTSDEQMQVKLPKSKKSLLVFNLPFKTEVAAIRVWNYNGHRVHSNIGVRKCHMKLDGCYIFSGEIQQSTGSSEDAYKYCEYVLFTQNGHILKKLGDKDWLNKKKNTSQLQRMLFKTTLENFHRPKTRNDEENLKKEVKALELKKEMIKLPKRFCFQYDPPQFPEGFALRLMLHSSWGDQFFVGLNGIEVFNEAGQNITNQNLSLVRAEPSSISLLPGYEMDKRVVNNLVNRRNNTTSDSDIWLAPLMTDVQKIEKGTVNSVIIQYSKRNKFAGINVYNYTKTPERGVREIEVYLDHYLLYRGYLRKYNPQQGIIHTTINFTKQQFLLQAMNYVGYNEDHLEQDVGLVNEAKILRQVNQKYSNDNSLIRPMTGRV